MNIDIFEFFLYKTFFIQNVMWPIVLCDFLLILKISETIFNQLSNKTEDWQSNRSLSWYLPSVLCWIGWIFITYLYTYLNNVGFSIVPSTQTEQNAMKLSVFRKIEGKIIF